MEHEDRGVRFRWDRVLRLGLGLARVHHASMEPTLRDGDRLLVQHGRQVRPRDLVVARFADGTLVVKRAVERRTTATGAAGWWLLSDNPQRGVDSRHRGPVPEDRVLAVVVGRVWPRPGAVRDSAEGDPPH